MMLCLSLAFAILGLIFMIAKTLRVNKQTTDNERMQSISKSIKEGAMASLNAEYRILGIFVVTAAIALFIISRMVEISHWLIIVAFACGAFSSALAGSIGMRIVINSNARTTEAARTSLPEALKVSFGGGTVMGLGVAGLAVLGLSSSFILFVNIFIEGGKPFYDEMILVPEALAGFSLGAEPIVFFARVGGGIYTKAADVGAGLVGEIETGIPEDDFRNPATTADNVGDNVGDVAGIGADLSGLYVVTVLASMVLGNYVIKDMVMSNGGALTDNFGNMEPILLPLVIVGVGIVASIIGTFFVGIKNNEAKEKRVQSSLNAGNYVALGLTLVTYFFLTKYMFPETIQMSLFGEGVESISSINVFYVTIVGLAVGLFISTITEYLTVLGKKPVLSIVRNSSTGAATNIIVGPATGMKSTFGSVLLLTVTTWGPYVLVGFYGAVIAASAIMATTAIRLAVDAFEPIVDNAGGVAEMSELPKEVRQRTDTLDLVGSTTAAIGKGFVTVSVALTVLALSAVYVTFTGIDGINILKAGVLVTLFIGDMISVILSALTMQSVGKMAMDMVNEVRRQFHETPGIVEGKGTPEYGRRVDISTKAALREMMLPGAITIITPIIIGSVMGVEALGAYMVGVAASGVVWAIFQNSAGGAWGNAKKSSEVRVEINGQMTYKGFDAHKAAATDGAVGDPFKDTLGPSMNILTKPICLVGLVIAPILGGYIVDVSGMPVEVQMRQGEAETDMIPLESAIEVVEGVLDADGSFERNVGDLFQLNLFDSTMLEVGENSSEARLVKLLEDKNLTTSEQFEDNWITLDRTYFKAGSDEFTEGSEQQLKNIVATLKAYPKAAICLGGYTDDTGSAEGNLKLSERCVNSVLNKLVALGVNKVQSSAQGYGAEHPIRPTNSTDECKAKNRRMDVRLTVK